MTSVDKREDTERAFLARCLAAKDAGRRALDGMDLDASFSLELTRRAAHYLSAHLEHPGQSLPAGADDLARLVAELVIRAGELASDPAALDDRAPAAREDRLDREIAAAQRAGEPVTALAAERQRVQHDCEHRQPAHLSRPLRGAERRVGDGSRRASRRARCAAPVDGAHDLLGVPDAEEPELGVVAARGVEVDGADLQQALEDRLVGIDVLHALDARLLRRLGEDPAADVQPLGRDHVARRDALEQADEQHEREHDAAARGSRSPVPETSAADRRRDRHEHHAERRRKPARERHDGCPSKTISSPGSRSMREKLQPAVPSATRTSVRVMDTAVLAAQLASGRSIEAIARELGRDPSTSRTGSTSTTWSRPRVEARRAWRHACERLEPLVQTGCTVQRIAEELGRGATTMRYWLEEARPVDRADSSAARYREAARRSSAAAGRTASPSACDRRR